MRSFLERLSRHRVARNAGAMGAIQLVNYGAAFVVLILLTRTLSIEIYGLVAFSIGIVQVLSVVLDLGFTLSVTPQISAARDDRDFVARLTGAVLVLKLAALALGALAVVAYASFTVKYAEHAALIVLTVLPLLGHALQPLWFFFGIEQMRYLTMFVVVAKVIFLALVWALVREDGDYLWVPLADGIAQLGAAVFALALVYRVGYRIALPRLQDLLAALRNTGGFFASRLASSAYSSSGVLILAMVSTPAAVAIYALPEQLYRAMHAVFAPVVQALYPYMAKEQDFALLRRVTSACAGLAALGAVAGHFLAPHIIPAVFGQKWHAALPVLDVFLVAITVHVLAMMWSYPLAAALGRTDVANSAVICGALLYLVLAAPLVVLGSASPTALAKLMVVSELYIVVHCMAVLLPASRKLRTQRLLQQQS